MKSSQESGYDCSGKTAFLLSVILHGLLAILFFIINIEISERKTPGYFIISFSEGLPRASLGIKSKTEVKNENEIKIQKRKSLPHEKNNLKKSLPVQKEFIGSNNDTSAGRSSLPSSISDSTNDDLAFARSLLDTFLVRHPEYSSLILKEQAKNLKDKKFYGHPSLRDRETLEKKLNDELHKYLRSKFPEGSEHALNKYTGPGLQIPIGDLIDLVKKIFK